MIRYMKTLLVVALGFICHISVASSAQDYQVLCYHDIFKNVSGVSEETLAKAYAFNNMEFVRQNVIGRQDTDATELDRLINQFGWLKDNGYNIISVQDLINAEAGVKDLPEKALMMTFDDGYESFYKYVFPLLKVYGYPAVLAVEGSWIATSYNQSVKYGDETIPRDNFLSKAQIREMAESGLVEFVSHTWDLHKGIQGNPQGNLMPAVTTRQYDPKTGSYEQDEPYRKRLEDDFEKNSRYIESLTGKRPRVMVWPFGSYNGVAQEIAARAGMKISMTLDDGSNRLGRDSGAIKRYYVAGNPKLPEFTRALEKPEKPVMRVMHVDLDYIYDKDPVQQDKNLGLLLERINAAGANVVFLQAFSDDGGRGEASSLYFPNRHLPMKADLFSRASWQIRTRTTAKRVYAWLPLLAFLPADQSWKSRNSVQAIDGKAGVGYQRLSPFSGEARAYIREIYEDLARNAYFSGILIHDDAVLSDYEDASADAGRVYSKWGLPADVAAIRADKEAFAKWTRLKTKYLSEFANELRTSAEAYRKPLGLARNYYAAPILNPNAEEWFGQSYADALAHFDWGAIMAMPYFEKADRPESWLRQLVAAVKSVPGAAEKTIFELQSKDWNKNQPISNNELLGWMRMLRIEGMQNFGYYPDDPFTNHPNVEVIRREFSTKSLLQ